MARRKRDTSHANQLKLLREAEPEWIVDQDSEISQILSTDEEVKRAVERNAIDRGALFVRLIVELYQHNYLKNITYSTRDSLLPGTKRNPETTVNITPDMEITSFLDSIEPVFVKYQELRLSNGVSLLIDKNIRWSDDRDRSYTPSADIHSAREHAETQDAQTDMIWAAEVKGGADPAGSDEHWKTASRALARIIEAARETDQGIPALSFIGTTIVRKVAVEIRGWLDRGDLVSAYNLTKIMEQPSYRQQFLEDMMSFVGYDDQPRGRDDQ